MTQSIPYFNSSIELITHKKQFCLDAIWVHHALNDHFSPIQASLLSSVYWLYKDRYIIPLPAVYKIVERNDSLFASWFKQLFHDKTLINEIIHQMITTGKHLEKAPAGLKVSARHKDVQELDDPRHSTLVFNSERINFWVSEQGMPAINTADFVKALGLPNSSNFIKRHRNKLVYPFDRFINPAFRTNTSYTPLSLIVQLEFIDKKRGIKGLSNKLYEAGKVLGHDPYLSIQDFTDMKTGNYQLTPKVEVDTSSLSNAFSNFFTG